LTQFQKGTSRDASKHDRNAGTAVFVQKGGTLKVMEEFNIQSKQYFFTSTVLELMDTPFYYQLQLLIKSLRLSVSFIKTKNENKIDRKLQLKHKEHY
jgi:hypothetical protein